MLWAGTCEEGTQCGRYLIEPKETIIIMLEKKIKNRLEGSGKGRLCKRPFYNNNYRLDGFTSDTIIISLLKETHQSHFKNIVACHRL